MTLLTTSYVAQLSIARKATVQTRANCGPTYPASKSAVRGCSREKKKGGAHAKKKQRLNDMALEESASRRQGRTAAPNGLGVEVNATRGRLPRPARFPSRTYLTPHMNSNA